MAQFRSANLFVVSLSLPEGLSNLCACLITQRLEHQAHRALRG
jgi:hypothetical protein